MVDDFSGYRRCSAPASPMLGCWAHARRKFHDLHQASGSPVAQEALTRIAALSTGWKRRPEIGPPKTAKPIGRHTPRRGCTR